MKTFLASFFVVLAVATSMAKDSPPQKEKPTLEITLSSAKSGQAMRVIVSKLKITLSAAKSGKPMEVTVSIKNISEKPVKIATFDGKNPYLGMFVLDFIIDQVEGSKKSQMSTSRPQGVIFSMPDPVVRELKPGEAWSVTADLRDWLTGQRGGEGIARLDPGIYEIQAIYQAEPEFFTGNRDSSELYKIVTNSLKIEIK